MNLTRIALLSYAVATAMTLQGADTKDVSRTVSLKSDGSVSLSTFKGTIRVTTWDRAEVQIHARIEAAGLSSPDQRLFNGTDVLIDASSDSVRIKTRHPINSGHGENPWVHYEIQMPRTAKLSIRDHRSNAEINDLAGELDLDTFRGKAEVRRLSGPLELKTFRGQARVDFAKYAGTSYVDTFRGIVDLAMPKDSKFDLRTDSDRRGAIETDFPMMLHAARRGMIVEGAVNGGGPSLRLSTFRGEIHLRAE